MKKHKTQLKICGNHTMNDIKCLNKTKVKFAGFIFYPPSKRYISPNRAKKLIQKLDKKVLSVGVFANENLKNIIKICLKCNLNIVQLHGDESLKFTQKLKERLGKPQKLHKTKKPQELKLTTKQFNHQANKQTQTHKHTNTNKIQIIKVFRIKQDTNLNKLKKDITKFINVCDYFLFDTFTKKYGGCGKTFNWDMLDKLRYTIQKNTKSYFVAGGINELNIKQALKTKSHFIDIASGAENTNYKKDIKKIKNIKNIIKQHNKT